MRAGLHCLPAAKYGRDIDHAPGSVISEIVLRTECRTSAGWPFEGIGRPAENYRSCNETRLLVVSIFREPSAGCVRAEEFLRGDLRCPLLARFGFLNRLISCADLCRLHSWCADRWTASASAFGPTTRDTCD